MAIYQEVLYDTIGNPCERKNLYLKEVASLERQLKQGTNQEKKRIRAELKSLTQSKDKHPYIIKLKAYKTAEKAFKKALRAKKKANKAAIKGQYSFRVSRLIALQLAFDLKAKFYSGYTDLSYDALMLYEEASIKAEQLIETIELTKKIEKDLSDAKLELKTIDSSENEKAKALLAQCKQAEKEKYKAAYAKLKAKRKERLISDQALRNGKVILKNEAKEAISVKKFEIPKRSAKEKIRSYNYHLKRGTRREMNVLESNVADVRRKTPYEGKKKHSFIAYFTFLLPGLGQILNGQWIKSILFFMLSLFAYRIAVPYALGYGNFQGQGIAGLVSLAEGGGKLDRSLIFMIEGIISIFLMIFVIAILFLSFKDVLSIEKNKIKGIRPRSWFETKTYAFEDGFPYMVSLPALVAIVFIVLVPIATAILLSFTSMDPNSQNKFVWIGLENYKLIALGEGIAGGPFWNILGWTLIWTFSSTTFAVAIGFGLAILANNSRVKGKAFFRTVYLLPWAVPAFITIMFFSIMFSKNGILTDVINTVFNPATKLVIKDSAFWSRITLIGLQGWLGSAYVFLLSTGVLQGIPDDLYEAAQIDGATAWQKLRKITLPIVLFQTAPLLVGQYTFNFNNFSIIYLFNGGGPFNPSKYGNLAGTTDLLISYIFKLTTEHSYQAIGAAITVVISMGLMLFAFIGFKNSKAFKEEKL